MALPRGCHEHGIDRPAVFDEVRRAFDFDPLLTKVIP